MTGIYRQPASPGAARETSGKRVKGWGKPCRSIAAIAKAAIRAGAPVYGGVVHELTTVAPLPTRRGRS
jgi:hypothetical protein